MLVSLAQEGDGGRQFILIYRSRLTVFMAADSEEKNPATPKTNQKTPATLLETKQNPPWKCSASFYTPLFFKRKQRIVAIPSNHYFYKEFPRCSVFSFCVKNVLSQKARKNCCFLFAWPPGGLWIWRGSDLSHQKDLKKSWEKKVAQKISMGMGWIYPPKPNQDIGSEIGMIICTVCMYIMCRFLGLRIPDYKLAYCQPVDLGLGGRSNPEIGFR